MRSVGVRNLIAVHACDVEALCLACGVEHGVVAEPSGAKAEVVAHQHVAHAQAFAQHFLDKGFGRLRCQPGVEAQHHHLVDAALFQLGEFVAQGADAGRCQAGLACHLREIVARVGLESQHTAGQAPVVGLVFQQRQHGLVAAVYAVEIANGQRAGGCDTRVLEATEDAHG